MRMEKFETQRVKWTHSRVVWLLDWSEIWAPKAILGFNFFFSFSQSISVFIFYKIPFSRLSLIFTLITHSPHRSRKEDSRNVWEGEEERRRRCFRRRLWRPRAAQKDLQEGFRRGIRLYCRLRGSLLYYARVYLSSFFLF